MTRDEDGVADDSSDGRESTPDRQYADGESEDGVPDEPLADVATNVRDGASHTAAGDEFGSGVAADERSGDRDGPLGELASDVARRRSETDDGSDLFTNEEVGSIDSDAVWERVEAKSEPDGSPTGVTQDPERIVSKSSYCQGCEHFTAPPAVGCEHEGTDILELVDTEQFRVRNCPKVAEDERLGDLER